ncbi:MAG: M20/M25/M40 family metallo-hydrolase [Flammeovirgaceae bacterium]|nr:M20/M25/M40 family metallo-hydrolase [Flammeovirgaceae bacterium]
MKKSLLIVLLASHGILFGQNKSDSIMIKNIYNEVLTHSPIYENLRFLCKEVGNRVSGSTGASAAVEYTRQLMLKYDFDTVFLQPIMVPNWKRGAKEILKITNSKKLGTVELNGLALGNSIGTGAKGVLGEIIEVGSIEEAELLGPKIKDKIVFYNGPMDPTLLETFSAYGQAVRQRSAGASVAAALGAKAIIIRSITQSLDDVPHTGSLRYDPKIKQIPAMAISTKQAALLSRLLKDQADLSIYMENYAEMLPDLPSFNVVGQLNGSEFPNEFIAVGGHLDSWDVGEGAHDDGSGCMQGIDVLRTFKALDITPKRSLRAVMWMNEENGGRGGKGYAKYSTSHNENHIAAIESDRGGFVPRGFTSSGSDQQIKTLISWKSFFEPYGLHDFDKKGGGADIGPLSEQGALLIGLLPDGQRYFRYHHTNQDVFEAVDRRELELGSASMAGLVYLLDKYGMGK